MFIGNNEFHSPRQRLGDGLPIAPRRWTCHKFSNSWTKNLSFVLNRLTFLKAFQILVNLSDKI